MILNVDHAHRGIDYAAGAMSITAPGWLYLLNEYNAIVAAVTGTLGFIFLAWRFLRWVKRLERQETAE